MLAPAAFVPASASQGFSPVATPLPEVEMTEAPAPVRAAPKRKVAPAVEAPIRAEKLPLAVLALTVVTAVLLVFGARSADAEGARVMTFAAAQPQP